MILDTCRILLDKERILETYPAKMQKICLCNFQESQLQGALYCQFLHQVLKIQGERVLAHVARAKPTV
jgi:hypothetical protein